MNSPKEKAIELVDIYSEYNLIEEAKQCALIAVDEILKAVEGKYDEYWQEVKQEIDKI
jgi:isocitrate dehydrogenase